MMRRPDCSPVILVLCLVLVLGTGAALATEEKSESKKAESEQTAKPAREGGGKKADDVVVYTNDELERMFSEPATPPKGALSLPAASPAEDDGEPAVRPANPGQKPAQGQPADPLKWMQDRQAREAEWSRQVAESEQEVRDAEQKVADLEYRLRATRIPFLARPEIPEEEQGEWEGLTAAERAERTQQQLDEARAELAAAQQKLGALRAQKP